MDEQSAVPLPLAFAGLLAFLFPLEFAVLYLTMRLSRLKAGIGRLAFLSLLIPLLGAGAIVLAAASGLTDWETSPLDRLLHATLLSLCGLLAFPLGFRGEQLRRLLIANALLWTLPSLFFIARELFFPAGG